MAISERLDDIVRGQVGLHIERNNLAVTTEGGTQSRVWFRRVEQCLGELPGILGAEPDHFMLLHGLHSRLPQALNKKVTHRYALQIGGVLKQPLQSLG